jgi:hypothetical protein
MAATSKKGGAFESAVGRPATGSLGTFNAELRCRVVELRRKYPGWGAVSIRDQLGQEYPSLAKLPSIATINRHLKQAGLVDIYEPHGAFPRQRCSDAKTAHDLWELDAQGAVLVSGIGYQSMINLKDSHTRIHCMAFPVSVKHKMCQPARIHYKWMLRFAFEENGLPRAIQVDKDSVFYENTTKSPYPTPFHLWLVALGVKLCHIKVKPPQKQAIVERSHQTLEKQVLKGQHYENWGALFKHTNERRQRLNESLPNRSLGYKAPYEVFPQDIHSGRHYSVELEKELLNPKLIHQFLANGIWYRKVSSAKMVSLGGMRYYLKKATPKAQVQITYDLKQGQFIFRNVKELIIEMWEPKGISKKELMENTTHTLVKTRAEIKNSKNFQLST